MAVGIAPTAYKQNHQQTAIGKPLLMASADGGFVLAAWQKGYGKKQTL